MLVDEARLQEFMGKMIVELGAATGAALVIIGDRLGLYKAIADKGPLTSAELAELTETNERYIREWLAAQAAGGYVQYDPETRRYSMSPEQAMVFAREDSPVFMLGAFEFAATMMRDEPVITEAFKSGRGVGWHEHDPLLFRATERFFQPQYSARLISEWIPALEGVKEKLEQGALVADVGCGHGASTIIMAKAFPKSQFIGFDYHTASVERASQAARERGLGANIRFEQATAKDYPGSGYDLVTFFDCLHDLGDPVGASTHVRKTLKPNATWMIVEPYANDRIEENFNPIGRMSYAASTMICTPASMSQEVGLALGTQAGESRIREVITAGGFRRVRRAAETPTNLILEARP